MSADECPDCGAPLAAPGWCEVCGLRERLGAHPLLDWLVPDHKQIGLSAASPDPLGWEGYGDAREQARETTGNEEAVVAVRGALAGSSVEVVAVAYDFRFLGGSMSSQVGAIVAGAYDAARDAGLPLIVMPSTGGARMQEGMASLVQMAATSVAATRHAEAGLLQISVLRDPTTGGVFASHANLADIVLAEPGATIGFAGPRVAEAMTGGPLPEGSHTATGAREAGLVDHVVDRPALPDRLAAICGWASEAGAGMTPAGGGEPATPGPVVDAWEAVERARAPDRPRTPAYLEAFGVVDTLHGDRAGRDDPSLQVGLCRIAGAPAVVVGLDRTREETRVGPAGYRKAWRGFRLADRLGIPVVTLVDTPGADASASSEAGGVAHHIARTFTELFAVNTPTVALVIGEGGSGGALALAVTDRLLIQEHATFSVIAPEGAAAILDRDAARARDVAPRLKPTAHDLLDLGIADGVVAEPEGDEVAEAVRAVERALADLAGEDTEQRLARRRRRWREAGQAG